MKYAFFVYDDAEVTRSPEEDAALMREYGAFTADVQKRGIMLAGEQLTDASIATTVRLRDGRRLLTDGPFADTKEVLGGYYVLECRDLDEALEYAAAIPSARSGAIEVRPLVVR